MRGPGRALVDPDGHLRGDPARGLADKSSELNPSLVRNGRRRAKVGEEAEGRQLLGRTGRHGRQGRSWRRCFDWFEAETAMTPFSRSTRARAGPRPAYWAQMLARDVCPLAESPRLFEGGPAGHVRRAPRRDQSVVYQIKGRTPMAGSGRHGRATPWCGSRPFGKGTRETSIRQRLGFYPGGRRQYRDRGEPQRDPDRHLSALRVRADST